MGVEQQPQIRRQQQTPSPSQTTSVPVCEGFVEKKKSDQRRIPIGPSWKRRYCMLSSDGLRLYDSKTAYLCGEAELRIIPMCHIKSARQVQRTNGGADDSSPKSQIAYFDVETERGEVTSFRYRDKVAWPALVEIELIRYKNKQDMARYKRMYRNNYDVTPLVSSCTCHHNRCEEKADRHFTPSLSRGGRHIYDSSPIKAKQGLKTVVLPNQRLGGLGIGITVIPLDDGRVVVNRLLQGGPAVRHGEIFPGDEIVSANGKLITSIEMLSDIVRNSSSIRLLVKATHLSIQQPQDDIAPEKLNNSNNANNNNDIMGGSPYHNSDIATRIAFEKGLIRPAREFNISPSC